MKKIALLFIIFTNFIFGETSKHNLGVSLKTMNGKSKEYVYDINNGDKISYLEWEIKNIPLLVLDYNYSISENLDTNFSFGKNISSSFNSNMKDYDWYNSDTTSNKEDYGKPYAYSKNKSKTDEIIKFDWQLRYLMSLNANIKLGPYVGINYDRFKFTAKVGNQEVYDNYGNVKDIMGKNNNKNGVKYTQEYITPYIGYFMSYEIDKLKIEGKIQGSTLGKGKAQDTHILTNTVGKEKYKDIKNIMVEVKAIYALTESIDINGSIGINKYYSKKSSEVNINFDNKNQVKAKGITGTSHLSTLVSIGANYKF